jgi:hypothetical protein
MYALSLRSTVDILPIVTKNRQAMRGQSLRLLVDWAGDRHDNGAGFGER